MSKEELFEQNQKLVYFTLRTFFPYLNANEDLIQTGMLGLWKACNDFIEGEYKFSTVAVSYVRREILYYLRRERKHKAEQFSQLGDKAEEWLFEECDPEIEEYSLYLAKLNPKEKDLFLRISRGQKQIEIAKAYELSQSAISKQCINLKRKLLSIRDGKRFKNKTDRELAEEAGISMRTFYRQKAAGKLNSQKGD